MYPSKGSYETGWLCLLRLAGAEKMCFQQPIDGCEKHNFRQKIEIRQHRPDEEINSSHHKLGILEDVCSQIGSNRSAKPGQPKSSSSMRISLMHFQPVLEQLKGKKGQDRDRLTQSPRQATICIETMQIPFEWN